jgi:hypothetical protein
MNKSFNPRIIFQYYNFIACAHRNRIHTQFYAIIPAVHRDLNWILQEFGGLITILLASKTSHLFVSAISVHLIVDMLYLNVTVRPILK